MTERHRKYLEDLIQKKGIDYVIEFIGLSVTQIAIQTGIIIDERMAYLILLELITENKIPKEYKGFEIRPEEANGEIRWFISTITDYYGVELQEEIQAIASPFYRGDWEGLYVDVDFYELVKPGTVEEVYYTDLWAEYATEMKSKSSFENLEELLEWYRDFYLPMTYEYIVNYCLPHIRKRVYDKVIKNIR